MLQSHSNKSNMGLTQNRHVYQRNNAEDSYVNTSNYNYLILNKEVKIIHRRKAAASTNSAGKAG